MKERVRNARVVQCSENDCKRTLRVGEGFYLGKRGKNRTDFYLCAKCDQLRKQLLAQRKINKASKRVIRETLFEVKTTPKKGGCGCTGILPSA